MNTPQTNAGLRLLQAQKAQGTNLCIGLDPHLDDTLTLEFYSQFADNEADLVNIHTAVSLLQSMGFLRIDAQDEIRRVSKFLAGLTAYMIDIVECSWECGIRVFKPQAAFYERFGPLGSIILHVLAERIRQLGAESGSPYFDIGDVKRGDIDTTMKGYYDGYLTSPFEDVIPGLPGQFGFNAITVLTWMGIESVLKPGLPYFKNGCGAIPVARSTNPDGTTIQDACLVENNKIALAEKQRSYRLSSKQGGLFDLIGWVPTAAEVMMYLCEKFSQENELNSAEGISPIFNVIGSTVIEDGTFRKLRPGGIALVPGFGAQGGKFANAMPMLIQDGSYAGQGAIFSSSRGHNFPWMKEFGGAGNPLSLKPELQRAITTFREAEKKAYQESGNHYPY